jgi:hypothetical protein
MLDRLSDLHPAADYVMLFLEDFFMKSRVDTPRVVELARVARQRGVGCLRLASGLPLAFPPLNELPDMPGVGTIGHGEPYRVTLQVAIWRIGTLRRLLIPGLSAWEFEQVGTHMSEGLEDEFLGVIRPAIEYCQAVEKGKWKQEGLAILREVGLDPGELSREVFSEAELESHYHRAREESAISGYRNAALCSFLVGRRLEGLRHIWRCFRFGNPTPADLILGLVGSLGTVATRQALAVYVRLRLWSYSRRESSR